MATMARAPILFFLSQNCFGCLNFGWIFLLIQKMPLLFCCGFNRHSLTTCCHFERDCVDCRLLWASGHLNQSQSSGSCSRPALPPTVSSFISVSCAFCTSVTSSVMFVPTCYTLSGAVQVELFSECLSTVFIVTQRNATEFVCWHCILQLCWIHC